MRFDGEAKGWEGDVKLSNPFSLCGKQYLLQNTSIWVFRIYEGNPSIFFPPIFTFPNKRKMSQFSLIPFLIFFNPQFKYTLRVCLTIIKSGRAMKRLKEKGR